MATLQQIRTKADAKLIDFWSALQAKQTAYYAKHKKYFQLMVTDRIVDGVGTDFVTKLADHEQHKADADFTFNLKLPFQIRVDEWTRLNEAGYSATVFIELLNGTVYTRSRTDGGGDTGWRKYEPDDLKPLER